MPRTCLPRSTGPKGMLLMKSYIKVPKFPFTSLFYVHSFCYRTVLHSCSL